MKNINLFYTHLVAISLLLSLTSCRGQVTADFKTVVSLKLVDENNHPVSNAQVEVIYSDLLDKSDNIFRGTSDRLGRFKVSDYVSAAIYISASKPGFYSIGQEEIAKRSTVEEGKIRRIDLERVMRRRLNSIPLYGRRVQRAIPGTNTWIGFDLKVGDWVDPHGKGEIADFVVHLESEFLGYPEGENYEEMLAWIKRKHEINPSSKRTYFKSVNDFYENDKMYTYEDAIKNSAGKWKGMLKIKFTRKHEGIALVDKDYHSYSELRMPHLAYEGVYMNLHTETGIRGMRGPGPDIDRGYFLRTRVELDENGEMVAANYAKFTKGIQFDPRGRIEFTYLFNPKLNDRNLEFNTGQNLFGELHFLDEIKRP